jgi:hypothetical protein
MEMKFMRTSKYMIQDYKTNKDILWELKIKPVVKRKFKITKINGYNMFSEWTSTTLYYEISTSWETKSRMTPHKTSRLLMGLEQVMRPETLQAIWWSSLQKLKDYNYFTAVLKDILHGL